MFYKYYSLDVKGKWHKKKKKKIHRGRELTKFKFPQLAVKTETVVTNLLGDVAMEKGFNM